MVTFGVRTNREYSHLEELEQELTDSGINWGTTGLAEVRRPEEKLMTLRRRHILHHTEASNG